MVFGELKMKTADDNSTAPERRSGGWLGDLARPFWKPEPPEIGFLLGLNLLLFLTLRLWGKGMLRFLGQNPVTVVIGIGGLAYLVGFRTRLRRRGEFRRGSLALAAFLALLAGMNWL